MRDCTNVEMRELLPELMHDRLPADAHARLSAHLATCAECQAELELLRRVRAAVPAPRVDVAGIASRLPAYRSRGVFGHPLRWAIAAGLVAVAGGSALLMRRAPVERPVASASVGVDSPVTPPAAATVVASRGTTTGATTPRPRTADLAVSETLADLSDLELRTLLAEMAKFEAMTSSETDVVVAPAVKRGGL